MDILEIIKKIGCDSLGEFVRDVENGEIWVGYTNIEEPENLLKASEKIKTIAEKEDDNEVKELLISFSNALKNLAWVREQIE